MKVNEKKWIRVRIYLVAVFFLFCLSTVFFRAVQLQVFEKDKLQAMAREGYRKAVSLPPERGSILDRENHELAVSIEVGSVYADPRQIEDKVGTAKQLALHLDMSAKDILHLLKKDRSFVYIKRKIPTGKIEQIRSIGLEGIGFTKETKRFFPGKDIAGHLLGIVGDENQGLEGIEKKYDDLLRGEAEVLVQMKDAHGRPFYVSKPSEEKRDIHNLVLTIDKDIQYRAQQALDKYVKKYKGKSGQCVIMDPATGEILAMATAPAFNPNAFREYSPDQWRNRVVTDWYEPGSAIKAFLLAAAIDMSAVTPNTKFYCEDGEFRVADILINDDVHKYGTLTVSDIVVLSSNIGAVKIGNELGYERFYDYLKKFGFGEKTGIELIGERSGVIRTPERANEVERATVYYGQGMSVTSLQLTTAMAAIANGGRLMRPYIVKAITDGSGKTVKEFHPQMVRRVISADTAKTVTRILEGVVSDKGTAPLAAIEGYRVAGKTGTAEKPDLRRGGYLRNVHVADFVGFVPANRPKLVILAMIDEPRGNHYGGIVAAPVFKEVGQWAVGNLGVQPEVRLAGSDTVKEIKRSSFVENIRPSRNIQEGDNRLPDFRGLTIREVLKDISSLGLDITFEGTGRAFEQEPKPGVPMDSITSVKVSFKPPA